MSNPNGVRQTLQWIALAFAIMVVVLCLGMPPFNETRGQARFSQCRVNLKQIALALHNYHDTYGTFPPAYVAGPDGEPWHSWRALLLPFLDQSAFYEQYRFDEPWNGPNNSELAGQLPRGHPFYFCPADDAANREGITSYVAVVGAGTLWPADGSSLSLDDIADGQNRTIHVVETTDSGIHWMEPRDLSLDAMSFVLNDRDGQAIRSNHPGEPRWFGRSGPLRINVAYADGDAQPLTPETSAETLRALLLRDDGGPTDF